MVEYKILLKPYVAAKLIAVEPKSERGYLRRRLAGMICNPIPHGARSLPGYTNRFRLRLSCHLIVYQLDDVRKELTVVALRVRNRYYAQHCSLMFDGNDV